MNKILKEILGVEHYGASNLFDEVIRSRRGLQKFGFGLDPVRSIQNLSQPGMFYIFGPNVIKNVKPYLFSMKSVRQD